MSDDSDERGKREECTCALMVYAMEPWAACPVCQKDERMKRFAESVPLRDAARAARKDGGGT